MNGPREAGAAEGLANAQKLFARDTEEELRHRLEILENFGKLTEESSEDVFINATNQALADALRKRVRDIEKNRKGPLFTATTHPNGDLVVVFAFDGVLLGSVTVLAHRPVLDVLLPHGKGAMWVGDDSRETIAHIVDGKLKV